MHLFLHLYILKNFLEISSNLNLQSCHSCRRYTFLYKRQDMENLTDNKNPFWRNK